MCVITKVEPGAICHKYILRNLKNTADVYVFAKSFINTMISHSYTYEQALDMLEFNLSDLPSEIERPDFRSLAENAEGVYYFLEQSQVIKSYTDCTLYYRAFDRNRSLCDLCPYYKKYSDNSDTEFAIIKYALTDYRKYRKVVDAVSSISMFFKTRMDAASEFALDSPCIIYITRDLFNGVKSADVESQLAGTSFLDGVDPFDVVWSAAFQTIRKGKIPDILLNNPNWAKVLSLYVKEKLDSATELSDDEVDLILGSLRKPKVIAKTASQVNLRDVGIIVDDVDNEPAANLSEGQRMDDMAKADALDTDTPSTEVSVVKESGATADEPVSERETDETSSMGASQKGKARKLVTIPDDLIILYLFEELDECVVLQNELPETDNQGFIRDKIMPVEVVYDKDMGYCYVIYSIYSDTFFVMPSSWTTGEKVFNLLSRSMIKIVCAYPYILQGLCRLSGHRVNNVLSLCRCGASLPDGTLSERMKSYVSMADGLDDPIKGFDEAVASAYMFGLVYDFKSQHIMLKRDGSFGFAVIEDDQLPRGRRITYSLRDGSGSLLPLIEYLFASLAVSADVWRYGLYILEWTSQYVSFYISNEDYECASTRIEMYLLEYIKSEGGEIDLDCNDATCGPSDV